MKKYINKLLIAVCAIMVYSCSEDTLDDINKNPNNPNDVASQYIITDVMTNTAFFVTSTDLAFYSSIYTELNAGIFGQMYAAEIRAGGPTASTTYDNSWTAAYTDLLNLKTIIKKCSVGGSEEGNYYTLGIAQTLTAYNLAILTDCFGDIPWSEALQPGVIYTPKLDKQQDLYTEIFTLLDSAIVNFDKESVFDYLGAQDFLYDGDAASIALWQKFANGLKARYTMHLSLRNPQYADVIELANKSFTSAAEQCQFDYNGTTSHSPYYQFYSDRNYFGASQSFHEKLVERNDPRDAVFFADISGAGLLFAPNGSPIEAQKKYGISAISVATAPTYLLSYHEVEFLKAEAYARSNDLTNALASLRKAVVAACAKVNIGIDTTTSGNYFDTQIAPNLTTAQLALKEIMIQKYIASYEEEAVEAYNDMRRLKAMGDNFISLSNPLNDDQFPLRFVYGASDVTTNSNIANVTGDGTYVYTENVWWAGGTR
jgi:hypothetical protein